MVDDAILLAIAEIAGVFVGFAALIGVTRRAEIESLQLGEIRAVVTNGLMVVVAALIPVALSAYDVAGRTRWLSAGLAYLLINWTAIFLALRLPENRRLAAARARTAPVASALFWLFEVPVQVPLVLLVLGVNRDLDPAFFLTALAFQMFEAALVLAQLVYARGGRS
jgi:hypothetical protein